MLTSKNEEAVKKTLYGMNEFIQNLDYDIKYYLNDTIDMLLKYLNTAHFTREVLYWALVTMSNTINVAEKKILPFKQQLGEIFHQVITSGSGTVKLQQVKGQALMCAGRLIAACGRKEFPDETVGVFSGFAMEMLTQEHDTK